MPYAEIVASMIAVASFIVFDHFLSWLNVAFMSVLLCGSGEMIKKTSCLWYTCLGIYRRCDDQSAPLKLAAPTFPIRACYASSEVTRVIVEVQQQIQ